MGLKDFGCKNDMPRGWVSESRLNRKIYDTWYDIWARCYDPYKLNQVKYACYRNVTVCDEWRLLSMFAYDIQFLKGYSEWAKDFTCSYHLDKDLLNPNAKVYSKYTCQFILCHDNVSNVRQYNIKVFKGDVYIGTFKGLKEVAKFVNRSPQRCCDALANPNVLVNGYHLERVKK